MTDYVLVLTATDSIDEAKSLGNRAVQERLAACTQIVGPIMSTYWWKGKIETADEYQVHFKTRAALADTLIARIRESHSYDVPDIIVTPIITGNPAYLEWISTETNES